MIKYTCCIFRLCKAKEKVEIEVHETMRKESALFSLQVCVISTEMMLASFCFSLRKLETDQTLDPEREGRSEGTSIWEQRVKHRTISERQWKGRTQPTEEPLQRV